MLAVLPELDQEGWTSDDFVRDMPVDYTLLVENLLDPGLSLCMHTAILCCFGVTVVHLWQLSWCCCCSCCQTYDMHVSKALLITCPAACNLSSLTFGKARVPVFLWKDA